MAKEQPISSTNRTKLFIKNLLKSLRNNVFSFTFDFSQLKSKPESKALRFNFKPKIKNSLKNFLKKIGSFKIFKTIVFIFSKFPTPSLPTFSKTRFRQELKKDRISAQSLSSQSNLVQKTRPFKIIRWGEKNKTTALTGWTLPISQIKEQFNITILPTLKIILSRLTPDFTKLAPNKAKTKISSQKKISQQKIFKRINRPKIKIKLKKDNRLKWLKLATPLLLIIFVFTLSYVLWNFLLKDLPQPQQLAQGQQVLTTKILSREGEVLFRIYEDENRTLVKLQELPQHLIDATIAIEDKNFYQHQGFSPRGIIRAAIANSQGRAIEQGGSTITQQLVKNRLLSPEKTIRRKLREIILSIWVEFTYSKEKILEMYLNQVAYGGTVYGIEEAAQRYFGKEATQLNLAESAMLAGLPVAPSVYSPFGPEPDLNKKRQMEVLRRMTEDGYITAEQAQQALKTELVYQQEAFEIKAPHFVMFVKQLLAEQYGEAMVHQGGLEVTTSLDWSLQQSAQQTVINELETLVNLKVSNGAALVTNPQTGEILAMVGSKDYFDFNHDGQVNVTLSPRQPGSSIKPLTYALALENGKTPSSIIEDSPITYHTPGSEPYSPVNYDGRFHGRVTLREALASSYNVPAVKTLAQIGVQEMIDQAQIMGIKTWEDRQRFGLSLTLGGGEVRMVDMAELYSAFANGGYNTKLNPILEVKNSQGEILYRNTCVFDNRGCPQIKSISATTAYQITDILADNKARTPAFGTQSVLHIPEQEVAVKTGTTNNLRDNWTIGYTSDRLVATWVGNNDNTPMSYVASGVTGASPLWNKIMRSLLDSERPHHFPQPENLIKVKICATTGTLPCQECPVVREELFKPGTEPQRYCSAEWFDNEEKESNSAESPELL